MIKRISKTTSLLVAAATIISMMPANASDAKKVESQEGTIYNAVAYKDGKFYIDGGVNDKDDATYYLSNGKYNDLSDIDSGSSTEIYGSKYLSVQNGDHFIDLSSGSVSDDSLKSDAEDDAATALRKNIKKDNDGRYDETDAGTVKSLDGKELSGNKFSDIWYGTQYTAHKGTNGSASSLNVYVDASGNYIDADYNIGSVKVTTTSGSTDKATTITNTDDKFDGAGGNDTISAKVDSSSSDIIGQDSSYIYRKAKITVTASAGSITKIDGLAISNKSAFSSSSGSVSFNVIQKISKAQASTNINGAKYAKTVTTYILSSDDGDSESSNLLDKYAISGGKIINYTVSSGSIKAQTLTLSSTNGYYYTDIGDQSDEDADVVDTDANGNLWILASGYISKWDNSEDWTKVYKVDGSFDKMSVYDDSNIVTWNEDDKAYSVIGGKTATTTTTDTSTTTTTTTTTTSSTNKGWVKTSSGWTYYNTDGTQAKGKWVNDGGTWYYIKSDGIMATGWIQDGSTWYYLQSSGAMKTGWLNDGGTWYYLNSSGAMLHDTTVDGYKLNSSGAWVS